MKQYLEQLDYVLNNGIQKPDRTGTGVLSTFGLQTRYNLREKRLPIVTSKKVHLPAVVHELLWFLSGSDNIKYLKDNKVKIWNEWARADGSTGEIYGVTWRNWNKTGIDQVSRLIEGLKSNPYSRRHILTAWNVEKLEGMVLPPCHLLTQFYVSNDNELSCQMYQRSADMFLGVPFNITSYSLLTHMIAHVTGLKAVEFIHTIGDAHIYLNHVKQVKRQLARAKKLYNVSAVFLDPKVTNIDNFVYEDISIVGYKHHSTIKAKISV